MTPPAPSFSPRPARDLWRSLAEFEAPSSAEASNRTDEFPEGASLWPADFNRRDFLKLLGGSLALAGLAGCGQRAAKIVPYVRPPETAAPESIYFASAMPLEGFARGVLVESHLGRPTKIEGNPDHPDSLGAADAMTQAAVLGVYDPDRSRALRRHGQIQSWETFQSEWRQRQLHLADSHGRGLVVLTEPTTSPTERRELHRLLDTFPEARWFQHTPLARYDFAGVQADYDLAEADVILSLSSDFLYRHPAALRYARAFSSRRRVVDGRVNRHRFYAIDAAPSVTTALADFRLPASPARLRAVLNAIARRMSAATESDSGHEALPTNEAAFVDAVVRDLRAHPGRGVCIAGPEQDADVQQWAFAMNAWLGAGPELVRFLPAARSDDDSRSHGGLAELQTALGDGTVDTLLILGVNPVYTAPADCELGPRLRAVPFTLHLGSHYDETAEHCVWHVPESHFLESWGDLRSFDGTVTIQQPLIEALAPSRSVLEILRLVSDPLGARSFDLVRAAWAERAGESDFEARWSEWLNRGVVADSAHAPVPAPELEVPVLSSATDESMSLTLILRPDAKLLDGRFANHPWLQELPHAITQLVWDNALWVSPAFARQHGVNDGDLVELAMPGDAGSTATVAIQVVPAVAPDCVALSLGYGCRRAGALGNARGFDAYPLRRRDALWQRTGVRIRKLDARYPLVTTQQHFAMEHRDLVRQVTPDELATERRPLASIYPPWPRGRYAWGMSIDLSTCLGCKACVVACQAENNIPSVGKDQVARGREMHWLRVDRYFSGDPANPRMLPQPVPCMHCENAPCEVVCPVAATVHSSEGLNDMIYNRCVGTRYCSNNCPYKVRRFNFLDYRAPAKSPLHLQENPEVSVRERGVMEKCTYCVQRINAGRIAAEKENRRIRDGEIKTACQQACPVDAIVFGDLNDPESLVSRRKREPVDYSLLEEQNTRPRTTYLAKVLAEDDAGTAASACVPAPTAKGRP